MKTASWCLAFGAALACAVPPAPAQTATNRREADEKLIRQSADAFTRAFNSGDARAVSSLWTTEGEYIDESGAVTSGREAIEKEFAAFFNRRPGLCMKTVVNSIRFLGPTVALEEGTSRLSDPKEGDLSVAAYTALHVKQDGRWLMASVHDRESASLTNYDRLRALEPLIGDWIARSGDSRVETSCKWIQNRNFIYRSSTAYRGDTVTGSGFEVIGIDPERGQITSWHFAGDGGVGHSLWHQEGGNWVMEARGSMPDGQATSAVNILVPVDADTFTWTSTERVIDGQSLPDSPVARIVRTKKAKQGE